MGVAWKEWDKKLAVPRPPLIEGVPPLLFLSVGISLLAVLPDDIWCRTFGVALAAGLLARGSTRPRTFPTHLSVVQFRACSPLTVAGAAEVSHPVPFSVERITHSTTAYTARH